MEQQLVEAHTISKFLDSYETNTVRRGSKRRANCSAYFAAAIQVSCRNDARGTLRL